MYTQRKARVKVTRFIIGTPLQMEPVVSNSLEEYWTHLNILVGVNLFLSIDDSEKEKVGTHMAGAGFFRYHI